VNYILDTHALIWFIEGSDNLSEQAKKAIENESATKYISIASLWEIAIKISLGKLILNKPLEIFLSELTQTHIKILPITLAHILRISKMDYLHKDPFDRIIIAQGLEEGFGTFRFTKLIFTGKMLGL
jgi:PIN domain nuclease of toxin-antitoxin system